MLFVSYSRRDIDVVEQLGGDLERGGTDAWRDHRLLGGQRWWDEILGRIRESDAVLFVLSGASVQSKWCRAELEYAVALGRQIVPVRVDDVAVSLAPDPVGDIQIVDYRSRTPETAIGLMTALSKLPWATPLPDPLPQPPPIPVSDLGPLRDRIADESLGLAEQREIITELLNHVDDIDQQETVRLLAEQLGRRVDLVESVRPDLESVIARLGTGGVSDGTSLAERISRRGDLITSLVTYLGTGRFTPIVGYGLHDSLIGQRREFAQLWADSFEFPLEPHRREDLAGVSQFVSVMTNADTLRARLGEMVKERMQRRHPSVVTSEMRMVEGLKAAWTERCATGQAEAHTVLAELPCPIYINASPLPLLSEALAEAGKDPVVEVCHWQPDAWDWPESIFDLEPDYRPSTDRPLVYHVFGSMETPESIVLTEDDYLDFMSAVSADRSLIPTPVRRALADSALLLLGLNLEDWDARVLLRAMVGQEGSSRLHRYTHVAAQVDPSSGVASPERTRLYLERYFGRFRQPAIDIYWGSVDDFVGDLADAQTQRSSRAGAEL